MAVREVSKVKLYGAEIELLRSGAGQPLLIFHGEWGNPGWLSWLDGLTDFETYLPTHPGFGNSERHRGLETIRDLADFYMDFIDHFRLERPALMGFSLGGWLAAELAATCPERIGKLVLVGAAGLHVEGAPAADIFLATRAELLALSFHDPKAIRELPQLCPETVSEEESIARERSQIMAQVLAWKPYMHNPKLPYRLHRIRMPALVVWGRNDATIPLVHGEAWARAIAGSQLKVIDQCGHAPHLEQPTQFSRLVRDFLKSDAGRGPGDKTNG